MGVPMTRRQKTNYDRSVFGLLRIRTRFIFLGLMVLGVINLSCSVKKYAINQLGNALAGSGTVFASDPDPELIRDAVPFSLKLIESLLAESPRVRESITWKVVQFSIGRPVTAKDVPILAKIHAEAEASGGTYESLLRAIALSDLVLKTKTEPYQAEFNE